MSGIIQCEIWTSLSQIEWIFLLLLLMPFGDHFLRISYQSHSREEHRKCSLIWLVWKEIAVSIPFHWDWIKTFLLHTTDFSNITTISSLKIFNNFSNLSSLLMPVREYSPGKEKSVLTSKFPCILLSVMDQFWTQDFRPNRPRERSVIMWALAFNLS